MKPCPFCGGKADVGQDFHSRGPDRWIAYCPTNNDCLLSVETEPQATEAEAIAAWNRRARPAGASAEPELRDRLDDLLTKFSAWSGDPLYEAIVALLTEGETPGAKGSRMDDRDRLILDLVVALKSKADNAEVWARGVRDLLDRAYAVVTPKLPTLDEVRGIMASAPSTQGDRDDGQ